MFSMVPLIKKKITGQVSGMVGAYGNIGGVIFLTILGFVTSSIFFMVIGSTAFLCFVAAIFLEEPSERECVYDSKEIKQKITVSTVRKGFD